MTEEITIPAEFQPGAQITRDGRIWEAVAESPDGTIFVPIGSALPDHSTTGVSRGYGTGVPAVGGVGVGRGASAGDVARLLEQRRTSIPNELLGVFNNVIRWFQEREKLAEEDKARKRVRDALDSIMIVPAPAVVGESLLAGGAEVAGAGLKERALSIAKNILTKTKNIITAGSIEELGTEVVPLLTKLKGVLQGVWTNIFRITELPQLLIMGVFAAATLGLLSQNKVKEMKSNASTLTTQQIEVMQLVKMKNYKAAETILDEMERTIRTTEKFVSDNKEALQNAKTYDLSMQTIATFRAYMAGTRKAIQELRKRAASRSVEEKEREKEKAMDFQDRINAAKVRLDIARGKYTDAEQGMRSVANLLRRVQLEKALLVAKEKEARHKKWLALVEERKKKAIVREAERAKAKAEREARRAKAKAEKEARRKQVEETRKKRLAEREAARLERERQRAEAHRLLELARQEKKNRLREILEQIAELEATRKNLLIEKALL